MSSVKKRMERRYRDRADMGGGERGVERGIGHINRLVVVWVKT